MNILGDFIVEQEELQKKVAPCGLLCHTCTGAVDGVIRKHSQALLAYLENYDRFAKIFSYHEPRLKKYPEFKDVLLFFSEAGCEGCRSGNCPYPGCQISPCIIEKGYDFCFECKDFPCERVDAESPLRANWIKANERMKEIGVQAYFDEFKVKSHYT